MIMTQPHICVVEGSGSWFIWCTLADARGHAVAHLFEALRYKPEGSGFYYLQCDWNFSLT